MVYLREIWRKCWFLEGSEYGLYGKNLLDSPDGSISFGNIFYILKYLLLPYSGIVTRGVLMLVK
jgi:hypothetical protein